MTTYPQPKAAAGVSAEPMISFPRWWVKHIRDGLMAMGKLPSGQLGDWAFLFREMLTDALDEPAAAGVSKDTPQSPAEGVKGNSDINELDRVIGIFGRATTQTYLDPSDRYDAIKFVQDYLLGLRDRAALRTLPSSDQCVAREMLSIVRSAMYEGPCGPQEDAWNAACEHIEEGILALTNPAPTELEGE